MGMQLKLHMVTIEDLVPQDHFLRKLESGLDLSFVGEETRKLYSHRYGRPPIDPVVRVKYLLVGYLYGIPSERQIERRVQTDMPCGGIWGWTSLTACRTTAPSPNFGGGNLPSERYSGGCSRRWCASASPQGLPADGSWARTPPM